MPRGRPRSISPGPSNRIDNDSDDVDSHVTPPLYKSLSLTPMEKGQTILSSQDSSSYTSSYATSSNTSHFHTSSNRNSSGPLMSKSIVLSPFGSDRPKLGAHHNNKNKKKGADPIYDRIPQEYMFNPHRAQPVLHFLPRLAKSAAAANMMMNSQSMANLSAQEKKKKEAAKQNALYSLRKLIGAAEDDIRLHRARKQAALTQNKKLLRNYQLERDPKYIARQERFKERETTILPLITESHTILRELSEEIQKGAMTSSEKQSVQLARWQRGLELFVYCKKDIHDLDVLGLLDRLLEGISTEDDDNAMSSVLSQAADMCSTLVDVSRQLSEDAADQVAELQEAYHVRLQAHEWFLRHALEKTDDIQEQFIRNGRAALQIGHQLEFLESKRRQCESASMLIRRWWLMESLAEQEALSGEPIHVHEEVRGVIPLSNCRMDPLFTRPEQSLEASRALRHLRAVVRSKGAAAAAAAAATNNNNNGNNNWQANDATRRFDLTANLIMRTSEALEQRLLTSFSEIYSQGGSYEFSGNPRPGVMDWRELRALAQALMLFDSGKNLFKRYVDMVITSRFPELFQPKAAGSTEAKDFLDDSDDDLNPNTNKDPSMDMDATRSTLASLFHRVSEVCTAEFELIAHVFSSDDHEIMLMAAAGGQALGSSQAHAEDMTVVVMKALLQRVISDPEHGLQARINDILTSIDRRGDYDAGSRKLDTFVVIHEKAAGLFGVLQEAAEYTLHRRGVTSQSWLFRSPVDAIESLKSFLTSQEIALNNSHGQGYLNLELRLLHHQCCLCLDQQAKCTLIKPPPKMPTTPQQASMASPASLGTNNDDTDSAAGIILEEYQAPVLPLDKPTLIQKGYHELLSGPLKQSVMRQPLIHATDSLARARLMFAGRSSHNNSKKGGDTTARVITSIYSQMCSFYGEAYLNPIVEALADMLPQRPPSQPPTLPFDEEQPAHDLGVDPAFWVGFERVHSAAKAFDRELWAEHRAGMTGGHASPRVWESLMTHASFLTVAKQCRCEFFQALEQRGEVAMLKALDTLSAHIQWILVAGGDVVGGGTNRILHHLTSGPGQSTGPYAIPAGSALEAPNSPAVKALTYCLRVQFVHVQAALTSQSLSVFWTALSMRLYDILVARLLQHYYVSTVGAIVLSRDVEALRSVAMLAGTDHSHWEILRELITVYMTPPDALKTLLMGSASNDNANDIMGTSGTGVSSVTPSTITTTSNNSKNNPNANKGLFHRAGRDQSLVFMSRRIDYRYKTAHGQRKSGWVSQLLEELGIAQDPADGKLNLTLFAAERKAGGGSAM